MYGLIYKVTNIQNRKVYIGQTTMLLEKRKKKHLIDSYKKSNLLFHKAIRKYKEYSFKWEILGYCQSKEELNISEIECISFFDSCNKIYRLIALGYHKIKNYTKK